MEYLFFNSYKTLKYEYSIDIKSKNAWVSGSVIIDDLEKNYLSIALADYLIKLPKNVEDKFFSNDEYGASLSFKSYEEIKLSEDIITFINLNVKKMILKSFQTEILTLSKSTEPKEMKLNLSDFFNEIDSYPDLQKIEKIENIIFYYKDMLIKETEVKNKIKVLEFYLENFSKLVNNDIYYSLNGWKIKDNKFNNIEKFFAGLIFAILINAFFLFFKSNYFRKFFKN